MGRRKLLDILRAAHIGDQGFRYPDSAVLLLIIFQYGSNGTANSQTGTVKGVNIFRFAAFPAEADIGPACLEILEIGATGNFPIAVISRQPYFQIVGFGGGKR